MMCFHQILSGNQKVWVIILLKDKKLANLYLSEAEKLITSRLYADSSAYITTGLKLFPDDIRLQNLNKLINAPFVN